MDLVCLFSFPLACSIDPACNHPCSQPTPLLDPIAHIPTTHSSGPPGSIHFMPFTPPVLNLSFILLPSLPVYTISICMIYAVPFAVPVMSISVCLCFVRLSSLCSSFRISSFLLSFLFLLFYTLSHLSLPPPFFYCKNPQSVFTLPPPFQISNVLYSCSVQFIASTFLMVEV